MEPESPAHTTRLLRAVTDGEGAAAEQLLPLVYEELRRIAGRLMQSERAAHTLQPTELIHEAYLRLIESDTDTKSEGWEGCVHFTRVAARAMRFVLVDHARGKLTKKRGGARHRITLDTQLSAVANNAEQLLFVHDGLEQLGKIDQQLADIVELRFFADMNMAEIARALRVSKRTVERGWRLARAWWVHEFGAEGQESHGDR